MSPLIYKQVKDYIDRAQHILLLTDERIDGDTIGSTLGMYHVLKELGKDVEVYSPKPMEESLAFLPGTEAIQRHERIFEDDSIDLVIIFDCSDGVYLSKHRPELQSDVPIVVFDHHETNPLYGTVNVVEPSAASTADTVWRFVQFAEYPVNKYAAQCILTGICTDTNTFSTSNTTAACMDAAHELSKLGAKLQEIVRHTMMNKSLATLKLWGLAFERLHENAAFGAVATAITQKDIVELGVTETDSKAMINFLNAMVEGVDKVLVLKETADGHVKGSMRSQHANVANIAKKFGGGGHDRAAGFNIDNAHLEQKDGQWVIVYDKD